jgi:hypothetical protein
MQPLIFWAPHNRADKPTAAGTTVCFARVPQRDSVWWWWLVCRRRRCHRRRLRARVEYTHIQHDNPRQKTLCSEAHCKSKTTRVYI